MSGTRIEGETSANQGSVGLEPVPSERHAAFETPSGIPIKRVYTPSDWSVDGEQYAAKLGEPGEYPFTRGVYGTMYRGRIWSMRQVAGYGTGEDTNSRFKYQLSQGATGLSFDIDAPTNFSLDSDDPEAAGVVGQIGVALDVVEDVDLLFADIPLDEVTVSFNINPNAPMIFALYLCVAAQRGISNRDLGGTLQFDVLDNYPAYQLYNWPPEGSLRLVGDVIVWCARNTPKWRPISIGGYKMREKGATAVQELAFVMANGIEYVRAALASGGDVDEFGSKLSFFFASQNNFFEEIAKFRAARRMWAKIMRERFFAKDDRSCQLKFHTQTAGVTNTAQQPLNNIVRSAYQSLAAVLGGTQSLHTNPYDEALALPTEATSRVALRTQQILAYETGITETVDPLAGSYFVESLTDELEARAWELISEIEAQGGMVAAIRNGFVETQIIDAAARYQEEIESGERALIGVNCYQDGNQSDPPPMHQTRVEAEAEQLRRLARVKSSRDATAVSRCLEAIRQAARTSENIMPCLIEAAAARATQGEMCRALADVWGTYRGPATVF